MTNIEKYTGTKGALKAKRSEMSDTKECCGNCARFIPDPKRPGTGWCDEWPVALTEDFVCHPYIGRPKATKKAGGAECSGKPKSK